MRAFEVYLSRGGRNPIILFEHLKWWPSRFCVPSCASALSHSYRVSAKDDPESERADGCRVFTATADHQGCFHWETRPQVLFLFSGESTDFLIASSLSGARPFFSLCAFSWQYSETTIIYGKTTQKKQKKLLMRKIQRLNQDALWLQKSLCHSSMFQEYLRVSEMKHCLTGWGIIRHLTGQDSNTVNSVQLWLCQCSQGQTN